MKSSKKQEGSKTTELRRNNEDLGKYPANVLIVWQAGCAPVTFFSPSIPFTLSPRRHKPSILGFNWAFAQC